MSCKKKEYEALAYMHYSVDKKLILIFLPIFKNCSKSRRTSSFMPIAHTYRFYWAELYGMRNTMAIRFPRSQHWLLNH